MCHKLSCALVVREIRIERYLNQLFQQRRPKWCNIRGMFSLLKPQARFFLTLSNLISVLEFIILEIQVWSRKNVQQSRLSMRNNRKCMHGWHRTPEVVAILHTFVITFVCPCLVEFLGLHHRYQKKDPLRGCFFLCAFSVLHLRCPLSQLDQSCTPPNVPLPTGSTLRVAGAFSGSALERAFRFNHFNILI